MIYFKDANPSSLFNLIKSGYCATLSSSGGFKFKETYRDPECTIGECYRARRSFSDLLKICQTYIPSTTKEELAWLLTTQVRIFCLYCPDIDKIVFCDMDTLNERKLIIHTDLLLIPDKQGRDSISLNMIYKWRDDYIKQMV